MSDRPHGRPVWRLLPVSIVAGATLAGCGPQVVGQSAPPTAHVLLAPTPVALTTLVPTLAPTPTALPTSAPTEAPTVIPATAAPAASAIPPTEQPTMSAQSAELRRQVFEEVWKLVDTKYLYPDFKGLNWQTIYDEYLPRITAAESDDGFYANMAEMIALLDDHHSRFLPPATALNEDTNNTGIETSVGIGVLTSHERDSGFIRTVFADSPAARADLRPRDRILAVDGRPYNDGDGDILGLAGTTVRLAVLRPGEKPRDVVLERQEVQGRITPTYRRFPGDIGYVAIPTLWVNDMDTQVSGAITELVAAGTMHGIIVDLRGNGGGWGHVLSGILGHFVRGPVGTFFDQKSARVLNVTTPAGPDLRGLPVAVLIDGDTQSYAEVLAAVLQEGGAIVVGTPSAGNTESVYLYKLRDGSRLWLAQENFKLRSGLNLEGHGVQPDSVVDVEWKRYSEDDDPQILEALRLLGAGPK